MFKEWRRHRATQRVKPGDGRTLKRFRWWQRLFRALFYLRLTHDDGTQTVYAVDVKHWQNQSSSAVKAQLYLNGRQHAEAKLPAVFPVDGGVVEVAMSNFGLKRCHYVTGEGDECPLVPDPDSAEGRRARLDRSHPALSRGIGVLSAAVLLISLVLLVPQIVEQVTLVEPVAERFGTFTSPIQLSTWPNVALGIATLAASMERALRLRFNWLLDAGGN